MGHSLVHMDISLLEKVVRTVVVYVGLAVLLRLVGKRDLAQLNSFDLIVVLLLSNVVQNAVIGPDNSLVGELIGAATLLAVNAAFVHVIRPLPGISALLEGTPTVLARSGRWLPTLRLEGVRQSDMEAVLRRQNA